MTGEMANDNLNKIDLYLDGEMNEEEIQDFEKSLEEDAALANELEIAKEINQTIATQSKFETFQEHLASLNNTYFEANHEQEKPTAVVRQLPNRRRRLWLVAASILVIIVGGGVIWTMLQSGEIDSAGLYASNFESYNLNQRSASSDATELEQQAIQAYSAGNYEAALPLLQELYEADPSNEKWILALGCTYLKLGQADNAIDAFSRIGRDNTAYQQSEWYLALAYLKNGQVENAKATLELLAKEGNRTYPTKAKELLKKF